MRRLLPVLLPLFLAAGCEGAAPPPPAPAAQLHAGFPPGGIVNTIVVDAVDPLPLRAADLIAPDGAVTPANYLSAVASPRFDSGQWAAGNPWQNALYGGTGVAAPALPNAQAGAALQSREQLLATVSTADIALPDPVAYRHDWARYKIRLSFGTPPGEVETREIAAPQPPPPASLPGSPGS
jgi:hypothetical protein